MKKFNSSLLSMLAAVGAVVAIGTANHATAADVTWGTVTTMSGASDVDTSGVSILATSYINNTGTNVVNGVDFTSVYPAASDTLPSNLATTQNGVTATIGGSLWSIGGDGVANDTNVLGSNTYAAANNDMIYGGDGVTLTLTGLSVGTEYLAQFFVADYRDFGGRSESITGGANTSGVIGFNYTTSAGGNFVIGSFVADSSTEVFTFNQVSAGSGTQLNSFQLETVPEPSTWAMMLGGLGMLTMLRRRRAYAKTLA